MSDYADWRLSVSFDRLETVAGALMQEAHRYENTEPEADSVANAYYMGAANAIQALMTRGNMPTKDNVVSMLSSGLSVCKFKQDGEIFTWQEPEQG